MRTIIFDFDKTLTRIDSGLLCCLCHLDVPSLLVLYFYSFLSDDKATNARLKCRLKSDFKNKNLYYFLAKFNQNKRILNFLRRCLQSPKVEVYLLTGAPYKLVEAHLRSLSVDVDNVNIVDIDELYQISDVLIDAKVQFLYDHFVPGCSRRHSVVNINDRLAELNAMKHVLPCGVRNIHVEGCI